MTINRVQTFVSLGKPQGKGRPRLGRHGVFTPDKTRLYEKQVALDYRRKYKNDPLYGYIKLEVKAFYPINKGDSLKTKEKKLAGLIRPDKKPDADNVLKIVADSLNHLAYEDDKQLVEMTCSKYYSDNPRIEVILTELNN